MSFDISEHDFYDEPETKGPTREELIAALKEVGELIAGYVDVVDGDYGMPAPNKAMRASMLIKEVLGNE